MSLNLKDDILNAVKERVGCKTPKFRKPTAPPPPNPNLGWQPTKSLDTKPPTTGSNAINPNRKYFPPPTEKKPCAYETPCGWCTKWEKPCDKKPYKRGLRVEINPIDDAIDVPREVTLTNKTCESEEDHQWECCGMSTVGSDYRCKKCGEYKRVPYTTSSSNYYKGE